MVFAPYDHFLIQTGFTNDQIKEKLAEVVDTNTPLIENPFTVFNKKRKPFVGKIQGNSFKIYNYNPSEVQIRSPHVIIGLIESNSVIITVRLPYIVLGFLTLFILTGFYFLLDASKITDILFLLFISGAGYSMFTGGLKYKAKESRLLLEELLNTKNKRD